MVGCLATSTYVLFYVLVNVDSYMKFIWCLHVVGLIQGEPYPLRSYINRENADKIFLTIKNVNYNMSLKVKLKMNSKGHREPSSRVQIPHLCCFCIIKSNWFLIKKTQVKTIKWSSLVRSINTDFSSTTLILVISESKILFVKHKRIQLVYINAPRLNKVKGHIK